MTTAVLSRMHAILSATLGVLVVTLVALLLWQYGVLSPRPYHSVEVVSLEQVDGTTLELVATYYKTTAPCRPVQFVAFGLSLGPPQALAHTPIRGPGQGMERTAGWQTLRWQIATDEVHYHTVEVRTRHECSGRPVNRIMLSIPILDMDE